MMKLKIKRDVLIPASEDPEVHMSCWAINHSYTSSDGRGMMMTVIRCNIGKVKGELCRNRKRADESAYRDSERESDTQNIRRWIA